MHPINFSNDSTRLMEIELKEQAINEMDVEMKIRGITAKSKEVEDVRLQSEKIVRFPLKRQLSLVNFKGNELSLNEDLEKKDAQMWKCIERFPNPTSEGYIYRFKLKDEFDIITMLKKIYSEGASFDSVNIYNQRVIAAENKISEIFPAGEPTHQNFEIVNNRINGINSKYFQQLGYRFFAMEEGIYLELPDLIALKNNLQKFCIEKDFPEIDIFDSDGVANDEVFTLAYIIYDLLLSSQIEFVHDQTFHITSIINLMIMSGNYKNLKNDLVKMYLTDFCVIAIAKQVINGNITNNGELIYNKELLGLNEIEKLEYALGATVDVFSTMNEEQIVENISQHNLEDRISGIICFFPWSASVDVHLPPSLGGELFF